MTSRARLLILCLALALVFSLGWQLTRAQIGGEKYYSQYGHWVRGQFLSAYLNTPNREQLYGYPVTEAFQEESTGLYVQYFEKVRMELRMEPSAEPSIYLTDVGQYLYTLVNSTPVADDSGNCREYPSTGLRLCHAFLEFFDANGGVSQFGQPVSGLESIDGLIVQYFVKARFEWRPELPQDRRVKVSDLGSQYFRVVNEAPRRLLSEEYDGSPQDAQVVTNLLVRAFPHDAVTSPRGEQSIYVIVQDQKRDMVELATVDITVTYSSGKEDKFVSNKTETNEEGVAIITFPVSTDTAGIVEVRVKATYTPQLGDTLVGKTVTSFRVWR